MLQPDVSSPVNGSFILLRMAKASAVSSPPHMVGCRSGTLLQTCKVSLAIKPLRSLSLFLVCLVVLRLNNYKACGPVECSPTSDMPAISILSCNGVRVSGASFPTSPLCGLGQTVSMVGRWG